MNVAKKFLCTCLIITMLFSFAMPILAFADDTPFVPGSLTKQMFYIRTTNGLFGMKNVSDYNPENEKNNYDWDLNEYKLGAKAIQTIVEGYPNSDQTSIQAGAERFNAEIEAQSNRSPRPSLGDAAEAAANVAIGVANDEEERLDEAIGNSGDSRDTADIGGILMKPFFALVNFVADSFLSILTNLMTKGQEITFDENNAINYEVNTSSFLTEGLTAKDRVWEWIKYSPEEIFSGQIDLLSIDFISGKDSMGNDNSNSDWTAIRTTIAGWYKVLRLIAIIGLLSVLIYTGIKILISSTSQNKAKYKEWIINWFIAVAILFSMHYIMAFVVAVTNQISGMLYNASSSIHVEPSPNGEAFTTNLLGLVRYMVQADDWYLKIGYEMMYIMLVVYTFKFTFVYLKRVLNMAFLTLIAPIVALTYPIDKMSDGTAQGFNMWLKEYTFNALLQPLHQILYYILVGSAVTIAAENPLYAIVVLQFMTEAEKLLKKIFGFDKASGGTVGGMAGAFTAGALASSVKDIARMAKMPKGNGNKAGENSDKVAMPKPTMNDINAEDIMNEKEESNGLRLGSEPEP